jgi:hypothetical protein
MGEDNDDSAVGQTAKRHVPTAPAGINGRRLKKFDGEIGEVHSVLVEIGQALLLISNNFHRLICITIIGKSTIIRDTKNVS